jgi:lactobin A/cerein 7B family class IIb bacteriocin
MNEIKELTAAELEQVAGGVIPVVAYAAFVSGAKWGAGIALATLAVSIKFK